jgi:hypothetical protein
MTRVKQIWREKRLTMEEGESDSCYSGDGRAEQGQNGGLEKETDIRDRLVAGTMDINMVFMIPKEFRAPENEVATLALGAESAMFEKPAEADKQMWPMFIKGHINGKPMGRMMVDGGASVNIMPLNVFEKLGHDDGDLKRTNMSLSGFAGEPTEEWGIISKELTVGNKTVLTAFFVVDVKGRYKVLLGRDWIHANECVPSTLHQFLVQWVGDQVEIIVGDVTECVAMAESQVDIQGGQLRCLIGRDLSEYNYVSISKDGFILISVNATMSSTRLTDDIV